MLRKAIVLPMLLIALLCSACMAQNNSNKEAGGDRDSHGCIGSAGYQWSALKEKCIRLFEDGIRLDPKDQGLDQTTVAYIVFKSTDEDSKVELFIPGEKAIILPKVGKDDAGTWKNKQYVLKQWRGVYSLENKGKLLYEGAAN